MMSGMHRPSTFKICLQLDVQGDKPLTFKRRSGWTGRERGRQMATTRNFVTRSANWFQVAWTSEFAALLFILKSDYI